MDEDCEVVVFDAVGCVRKCVNDRQPRTLRRSLIDLLQYQELRDQGHVIGNFELLWKILFPAKHGGTGFLGEFLQRFV